jgi:hypothetical protein
MDSSIKPKPLIGEILPGFTFLVLFLFCYFRAHPCQFEWILSMGGGVTIAVRRQRKVGQSVVER